MESVAEIDVAHLLQRRNRGGTLKISAAPLLGDDTMEIQIILHLHPQPVLLSYWLTLRRFLILKLCAAFKPGIE